MTDVIRLSAMLLLPFGTFAGCAITSQNVTMHPRVELAARPELGGSRRVAVQAIDAWPIKLIGYRGGVLKTGPITTQDDLAAAVGSAVGETLTKLGFQVVPENGAEASLRLELHRLDYDVVRMPHSDGVAAAAAIKAVASAGERKYEESYSKELLEPVKAAPPASFNERLINRALAAAIADVLKDEKLLSLLGGRGPSAN